MIVIVLALIKEDVSAANVDDAIDIIRVVCQREQKGANVRKAGWGITPEESNSSKKPS